MFILLLPVMISQDLFNNFLEQAERDLAFGFPSYIVKRNNKYFRYNIVDGQYYFDASREKATRFREYQAIEIQRDCPDVVIEVVDDPHTRATNAFWRTQSMYQVTQVRMEGEDIENTNNQFFGITPGGQIIELHPEINAPGMTEVFWCNTQEVPFQLFGLVGVFTQ